MGLPALLFPESQVAPPLIAPEAVPTLRTELRSVLDDVRKSRPAEGTPEETAALTRVSRFSLLTYRLLQTSFLEILRQNLHQVLADLVSKELATAEPARRLALRHIQQAVDRYGVLMEAIAAALANVSASTMKHFMEEAAEQAASGELELEPADRLVLRFQLDVIVALDVLDAPLEELTFWAFRAITSTHRIEALPIDSLASQIRGELARVRARHAWDDWDDEEIERELAPWPKSSQ